MTANTILFGSSTLYTVAANQLDSVRRLLSQCPTSAILDDVLFDLEACRDVLITLSNPAEMASLEPPVIEAIEAGPVEESDDRPMALKLSLPSELGLSDREVTREAIEVLVAACPQVAEPEPVRTVLVGPFKVQTTVPADDVLAMMGTPVLMAYARHYRLADVSSKAAILKGLKAIRDAAPALRPFDLKTLRISASTKADMMGRRWTQNDVDAFCKGAKMERVDATLFVEELAELVPTSTETKPVGTIDGVQVNPPAAIEVKTTKPVAKPAPSVPAKPATTPTKPAVSPKTGKPKPKAITEEEQQAAQKCGLTVVMYRILSALASDGRPHTYRAIEAKTGYYSILTAQLRTDHMGSLGNKGLVKEEQFEVDGKDKLHFTITAKGAALLKKGK